jgi:hypothetical protein
MLNEAIQILGAGDNDYGKIFAGIIFLIIWGISAVVSKVNKQQQEARRRLQEQNPLPTYTPPPPPRQRRIAEGLAERFPEVMMPPMPQRPVPQRAAQPRVAPQRSLAKPKRSTRRQPAVAARPTPPPLPQQVAAPPPAQVAPPVRRPAPASASAPTIARWLRPQTLRSQFILTEVLRPPLALRADESLL